MADILILANSKKLGGFCVAGKDIVSNEWVRIVGDQDGAELSLSQITYNDIAGKRQMIPYEPFNKYIRLSMGNPVPLRYQPENVLIGKEPWQEIQVTQNNISYDTPVDLWGTGDRIKADNIERGLVNVQQSLYYIKVEGLKLYYSSFERKLKRRMTFIYNDIRYDLSATMNEHIFDAIQHNRCPHNNCITVSLGESFNECHYKLVAAVF